MATVNLGRIKPVFRGAYSGSDAYVVDDIVTHGDESFICIQAHGAGTQATTQTSYWTKLAAKGTDGTDVGTTITTQGDILYRDGSGLQRLAKPASNKFLQNTSGGVLSWETVTANFVKATQITDNTRVSTANDVNDKTVISNWGTINKTNASGVSDLWCHCVIPTRNHQNDNSWYRVRFNDGSTDYDFDNMLPYSSGGSSHSTTASGVFKCTGLPSGNLTVSLTLKNNGVSSSGGHIHNPNSSDNNRLNQTMSVLLAYEILS